MGSYIGYVDTMDATSASAAAAVVFTILGVILLFVLVFSIFLIIGQWKMFKKAGEPGWAAIVPIYNTYILCKITGVNPWWILITYICSIVGSFIPVIGSLVMLAASIYFGIMLAGSTAKSFGKDTGWAIGLYFLKPFFSFALGVGHSEYVGPTPMNDPIMGSINKTQNPQQPQPNVALAANNNTGADSVNQQPAGATKFCPNCGTQLDANSSFCPNCGNKL